MRAFEILLEAKASNKLKHGSTRGNIGEFLLGSAVISKLLAGSAPASLSDMHQVMRDTVGANLTKTFEKSGGEFADRFTFRNIIKNKQNISDINDIDSLIQAMPAEINSALKFANSDQHMARYSRLFEKNGKPDEISVEAVGEEDQSESKADINLKYIKPNGDTKLLRVISLKVQSPLIGQGSPRTFETIKQFFSDMGITVPADPDYDQNVNAGVQKVLQYVANDLNGLTAGDDNTKEASLISKISSFLNKHAALNDPKLIIVNLENNDFSVQTIKKMISNLSSVNLETTFIKTGRPAVLVHAADNQKNVLFKIRYTYSPKRIGSDGKTRSERHRLFVEVGPLFKSLATINSSKEVQ
jgi:hypothetical protein